MKKQILIGAMALLSLAACAGKKDLPCGKKVAETYRPVVFFAFDSAELAPQAKMTLDQIAKHVGDCPHQKMRVIGYTDSTGSPEYNMKLGEERAIAVQNYLLGMGFKPTQIEVISNGQHDPMATNATSVGRAENRRAVVKFY